MGSCTCDICQSPSSLIHDHMQGYLENTFFKIYHCENCNTSFSMPRSDASDIYESIYRNGQDVPGYSRYWRYFHTIKEKSDPMRFLADSEEAYWGVITALKMLVTEKKEKKVLEIGSGLGYLTYALHKDGYHIQGMDLSTEAVKQARQKFGDFYMDENLFDHAKTHSEEYDIVILTEVIEHVDDPVEFLRAIKKLLTKNGKIIATTPNRSIAPSSVAYDTESPPVHHWWLSEESMINIGNTLNLQVDFIDYSDFYKRFPMSYNIGKQRRKLRKPILNSSGELLRKSKSSNSKIVKKITKGLAPIWAPFIKIYLNSKSLFNPEIVILRKRGEILCAIFEK